MLLRRKLVLLILILLLGFAVLLGAALGAVSVPLKQSAQILLSRLGISSDFSSIYEQIIVNFRLPRVLMGALIGFVLALCGGVMQGIFRNPLADPYLLGIASGATAGAAAVIALHLEQITFALPAAAFSGGLLAVSIVYRIASTQRSGRFDNFTLILAGVALAALFSAITAFFLYMAGERERRGILFWVMGGLAGSSWPYVYLLLPIALLGGVGLWVFARDLNALALGEEQAAHLGIEPGRLKKILLAIATLMTAAAVSTSGTIGFVGLIVPHAIRLLIGPDHRWLLPTSALAGAVFLMLCDTAARMIIAPAELPVGIITALFGAPFFLYLLRRSKHNSLQVSKFAS